VSFVENRFCQFWSMWTGTVLHPTDDLLCSGTIQVYLKLKAARLSCATLLGKAKHCFPQRRPLRVAGLSIFSGIELPRALRGFLWMVVSIGRRFS